MIIAQLATIPSRKHLLKKVIASLEQQVDELHIMCNDFDSEIWEYKTNGNVYYWSVGNYNKGDCEKFYGLYLQDNAYILTMDDDLVYPPDYVKTMINHIERYQRAAIVTLHGRTFPPRPIKSYYRSKKNGYHWNIDQSEDVRVDAGGTGVMAWHSDTFHVPYDRITHGNMGDVWVSKFAREQDTAIMCVNHKSGWLEYIGPDESDDNPQTIWSKHHNNDPIQTKIYNES